MVECKGFLFDLDGTLVDSLPAVERAWIDWANSHGIDTQEVLAFIHGKQAITSLRHFMSGASEEAIQQEFLALERIETENTAGVVALPGALEILHHLNDINIPWAIVTSGTIPIAHARHKAAGLPLPKTFITAELVARGKPEPDAYLLGAQKLGLAPQDCVVVEDAPAGLLSGLGADCKVVAVNAPTATPCLAQVDIILSTLSDLIVTPSAQGVILTTVR